MIFVEFYEHTSEQIIKIENEKNLAPHILILRNRLQQAIFSGKSEVGTLRGYLSSPAKCIQLHLVRGTQTNNMSEMSNVREAVSFGEFKQDVQLQLFLRRYEKALEGKLPIEEKIWLALTKIGTTVRVSWRLFIKRFLDIVLSITGLIVSLPLMGLIAVAIRMESQGVVLFRQARIGMRGKVFFMLKFRTMKDGAEAETGPIWALENDPRVTIVGAFLRSTHLDELPQLINVLKGEMSIVGPRPERPYFVNEFRSIIRHYDRRLCVKPGITGLAQIKRGYDQTIADVKKKLKYDLLYVQNVCPFLDLKLMAMTLGAVIARTGR